jgi:hypothetical protein
LPAAAKTTSELDIDTSQEEEEHTDGIEFNDQDDEETSLLHQDDGLYCS